MGEAGSGVLRADVDAGGAAVDHAVPDALVGAAPHTAIASRNEEFGLAEGEPCATVTPASMAAGAGGSRRIRRPQKAATDTAPVASTSRSSRSVMRCRTARRAGRSRGSRRVWSSRTPGIATPRNPSCASRCGPPPVASVGWTGVMRPERGAPCPAAVPAESQSCCSGAGESRCSLRGSRTGGVRAASLLRRVFSRARFRFAVPAWPGGPGRRPGRPR